MVHEHQEEIGRLVWAGKYREAVRLHVEAYERDPERECVPLASTLYSARAKPGARKILLEYIDGALYSYACGLDFKKDTAKAINEADVISTIFVWAAQQDVDKHMRMNLLGVAEMLVAEALNALVTHRSAPHTQPLLTLTRAQIRFLRGGQERRYSAMLDLYEARNLAATIADPRQRERVLRKAGMLFRANGKPGVGLSCLLSALFVRHSSAGVKMKTLAAIAGVER